MALRCAKAMTMLETWNLNKRAARKSGPSLEAFFSYGFRPFFLGAAAYAALLMIVWLGWVASVASGGDGSWLPVAGSPYAWHAHEFVFGFAAAAIGGFLLTAVPNWTGALPLSGPPLVLLFLTWLVGRAVMAVSGILPPWLVAAADLAFLPLLGGFAARQLMVKPAARNLVFLAMLSVLTLGNAAFHLAAFDVLSADPQGIVRKVLLVVMLMISVIGGRIIPAFTHNWLHLNAPKSPMPRRIARLDGLAIGSIALLAGLFLLEAPAWAVGLVALVAGVLNGARLAFWRGWSTRTEPIVWILHLGYAWLVVGLGLAALASLTSLVPMTSASHAFGTGAAGTMILAVMSRASLGHTGRPILAPKAIVWSYLLVTLAAAVRTAAPLLAAEVQPVVLSVAALAWIGAFGIFAIIYAPILTTPRVHAKVARG